MKKVLISSSFALLFMLLSGCGGSNTPTVVGTADEAAKYETPASAGEDGAQAAAEAAKAAGN